MNFQQLLAIGCIALFALWLSGCECTAESDGDLCDRHDTECGEAILVDNCGDERTVECGECTNPDECVDGLCQCMGATDDELCDEHDLDCGEATVDEPCGDERTVDCGDCSGPDTCIGNSCQCIGESEDELCEIHDLGCGEATVEDQCGDEHTVDCGDCSSPDECIDNACECIGESDDELCDDLDGVCGTTETTDRCGENRTIDCGDCPDGNSTFGAVIDAETGELLDDAELRVYQWPPPGGEAHDWVWEADYRASDPDFTTTTSSTSGDFNFEFATDESICLDDQVDAFEPYQWYRFVVERDGYDPGVFYRTHGAFDASSCPSQCPTGDATGCHRIDFELFSDSSDYARYPNLVSDARELQEHEYQCTLLPDSAPYDELIGLRVRLGGANIGPGSFHLEGISVDGGDDYVLQYVERTDGSVDSYTVDSNTFYEHDSHGHVHFMNWFRLSLVEATDECRDVDDRSDSCVTHDGEKISFCLHDFEPFDGDVGYFYDGLMSLFPDPPTCDTTEQGVTPGWIDVYNKYLPGQALILGEPDDLSAIGTRFIEAEVDPDQVLEEVERHGNVAQLEIDIPSDGDSICDDSSKVLDCSMPPSDYTSTAQQRQCGDYLDYAGVD